MREKREKVYTAKEVAARYRVTIFTVYEWVKMGKLRSYRVGRKHCFREEMLREMEEVTYGRNQKPS